MADTPKVYVICDQNCKFESMTKEQIYTAIIEALETGGISNVDTGFIQTIKTINNVPLKFFVGTQFDYDALSETDKENLFAIISDDTSKAALAVYLEKLRSDIDSLEEKHNGLADSVLAIATYRPSGGSEETFSIDLPRGKKLKNLAYIMIKYLSITMICLPCVLDDGRVICYGRGETSLFRGGVSTYNCAISFKENEGKITGSWSGMHIGKNEMSDNGFYLSTNNAYTGGDYIKLFFY